jgi:hypothetical protein
MSHEWRLVLSLNSRYEIDNFGNIRNSATKKILKVHLNRHGYLVCQVRQEVNRYKNIQIHCLVAECFVGDKPVGKIVNHIDGVKTNNAPENLEYVTYSENINHAYKNGLRGRPTCFPYIKQTGKHPQAKIDEDMAKRIKILKLETNWGARKIAKALDLPRSLVAHVIGGRSWKNVEV